ncbi:MAG: cyclic nucleotide-binding domain-containing protein [Candidatus Margulisbacteria bacterium]|nr:cyclic nucleotide-binding domain-containing protein [Candidatus Margulisiibacteriota bacterium]
MKKYEIVKKEIFSLLTSKQIEKMSEIALIKDFEPDQLVYEQKEVAKNLFILLEGEVSLRVPSRNDTSIESLSLEIENLVQYGTLFGTNLLFDVNRYMTRALVIKPSKVMILDAKKFLEIIRENKSEFIVMSYLAKVYFQRYINAMKEFEECAQQAK